MSDTNLSKFGWCTQTQGPLFTVPNAWSGFSAWWETLYSTCLSTVSVWS